MNNHYTVENIEPKEIRVKSNTGLWNIGYDSYAGIFNNPATLIPPGTVVMVSAIAHHNIGYDFYLESLSSTHGYSAIDCEDNTPIVEEAAEAEVAETLHYENMTAPKVAPRKDRYELVVEVDGYDSSGSANAGTNPTDKLETGQYYIFTERPGLINLTKHFGQPGWWVRVADNVLPPEPDPEEALPDKQRQLIDIRQGWEDEPEPVFTETPAKAIRPAEDKPNWHSTYRPFFNPHSGDREPVMYAAIVNAPVVDLEGRHKDSYIHNGDLISIAGTVEHDGRTYGRAAQAAEKLWWHSVDMDFVDLEENVYGYDNRASWWEDMWYLLAGRIHRHKLDKEAKNNKGAK